MEADIVQFVPFREFAHDPTLLAKETLEELPSQMLNYFLKKGILPNQSIEMEEKYH